MVNTFLKSCKGFVGSHGKNIVAAVALAMLSQAALAEVWGGDALCTIATNTKLTLAIVALVGLILFAIFAVLKKGEHLLEPLIAIVMILGIVALGSALIVKMGYTISCAGV